MTEMLIKRIMKAVTVLILSFAAEQVHAWNDIPAQGGVFTNVFYETLSTIEQDGSLREDYYRFCGFQSNSVPAWVSVSGTLPDGKEFQFIDKRQFLYKDFAGMSTIPSLFVKCANWNFDSCVEYTRRWIEDRVPVTIIVTVAPNMSGVQRFASDIALVGEKWYSAFESAHQVRCVNGVVNGEGDISCWTYPISAIRQEAGVSITFDANGGEALDESEAIFVVTKGCSISDFPVPLRWNYEFKGWFTAPDGGEEVTDETIFDESTTLYAQWAEANYVWSYDENLDGTITITGVTPCSSGITIPSKVDGKRVKAIGEQAFSAFRKDTKWLKGVRISDGIEELSWQSFAGCEKLTEVYLPTTMPEIRGQAFEWCSALRSIIIPSSVRSIGYSAFHYCTNLENVVFEGDEEAIDIKAGAFSCTALPFSLVVRDGVLVGYKGMCITNLVISEYASEATIIGWGAFEDCDELESLTIPVGITEIGASFRWCSNLSSVIFEGDENEIEVDENAFGGTPYEASIPFELVVKDGVLTKFKGACPAGITIPSGTSVIGENVFYPSRHETAGNITDVTFNEGLETIESHAFYNCYNLHEVILPSTVTNLANSAFGACHSVTNIVLNEGLQTIGYNAFGDGTVKNEITLPTTVKEITKEAFIGTDGTIVVNAPWSLYGILDGGEVHQTFWSGGVGDYVVTTKVEVVFYGEKPKFHAIRFNVNGGEELECDEKSVIDNRTIGDLPIPSNNSYVFLGWFTEADGGDEVTADTVVSEDMTLYAHWAEISYAYSYIDNGDGTVALSRYDIYGNWIGEVVSPSPVGEFIVPSEIDGKPVVAIGGDYFYGCEQMTSVVIPASVTDISASSFWCWNLTNITVDAENPAFMSESGILYTKDGKTLVCCPQAKGGDIEVIESVESIGWQSFYNTRNMTSISFPEGLKSIEDSAFTYCQNVGFTSISIPASVEYIGQDAFAYCSNLATVYFAGDESSIIIRGSAFVYTPYEASKPVEWVVDEYGVLVQFNGKCPSNLVIPSGIKAIGDGVFYPLGYNGNRTAQDITNVDFGNELEVIGPQAFENCNGLRDISIPSNVKMIGSNSFSYCYNLTNVVVAEGVESVGDYAFAYNDALAEVTLPVTIRQISSQAFGYTSNPTTLTIHAPWSLYGFLTSGQNGNTTIVVEYYGDTPDFHVITFYPCDGALVGEAEKSIPEGAPVGSLPTAIRDGYVFLGWFTESEGGEKVTAETVVTGDMTLYARWEESPFSGMSDEYPWIVDGDGNWRNGEMPTWTNTWAEVTVEGPCKVSFRWMRVNGYMSIYVDGRWFYGGGDSGVWNDFIADLIDEGSHVIRFNLNTALYSGMPTTGIYYIISDFKVTPGEVCIVSFDTNGGAWRYDDQGYDIEVIASFAGIYLDKPVPTSQSLEFSGWWTSADDSGEEVGANTLAEDGMTLYAHWQERESEPEWYYDYIYEDEDEEIAKGVVINGYSVDFAGALEIPAEIDNLPVVAISEWAFEGCCITSVTIPSSVTRIEDYAFAYCRHLQIVTFNGDESKVKMNKFVAFAGAPWIPRPENDEYENAQYLESSPAGHVEGTLTGATIADNDCIWYYGDAERTIWYKWTSPFTGYVRFTATAENGGTHLLYLVATHGYDYDTGEWDDCGYQSGHRVTFEVEEGETYYVSIATWNYVVNDLTLSWEEYVPPPPPENDDFADAVAISGAVGSTTGYNIGATIEGDEPLVPGGFGAVWWKWTAPAGGMVSFDTHGSDYDTVIAIYTGDSIDDLEFVKSNDDYDYYDDYTSHLEFNAVAGTTYCIAIGGYGMGSIVLAWNLAGEESVNIDEDTRYSEDALPDNMTVAPGVKVTVEVAEEPDAETIVDMAKCVHASGGAEGQEARYFKGKGVYDAENHVVVLSAVIDEEEVKFGETVVEVVESFNDFASAGEVTLDNVVDGFYYGLAASGDLSDLDAAVQTAALNKAEDGSVTLEADKPSGSSAFFRLIISDRKR